MSFISALQNFPSLRPVSRREALLGLSLLVLDACTRSQPTPNNQVAYYTCTMHPSVRLQDPQGRCPICGMSLIPVLKSSGSNSTEGHSDGSAAGMIHVDPERLTEIQATTELILSRTVNGVNGPAISNLAVLPTGHTFYAFVDHGEGDIEPRQIKLGAGSGDYRLVLAGLRAGERVYNSALFLIDAECRTQGVLNNWGERP